MSASAPRIYQNYIGGKFVPALGGDMLEVENPSTGERISFAPSSTGEDVSAAVGCALEAQPDWSRRSPVERASHLKAMASAVRSEREFFARTISEEQGKTLELARLSVDFSCDYLDYTAEWARRIEGDVVPSDRADEMILILRQAIGVIGGIVPWNFPLAVMVRKLAPALLTGNTIVLKPSELTPNNAHEFARIVDSLDLPAGVFNLVSGTGAVVGNALASDARLGMVSITGSTATGTRVMEAAAPNITRVNLELGGSAPAIVLADADLDAAAGFIRDSRVVNSGQVCNCADRIYVERSVADEFITKFTTAMARVTYGDPLQSAPSDMGPLVSLRHLEEVERRVAEAVAAGATVLTGGRRSEDRPGGYFFPATVLADCDQTMAIVREEIFGPVMPIVVVDSVDEAIAKANDSDYGLTSSVYTRDLNSALRVCRELQFGETYVNRENGEAYQGFHAGWRKSGIGGADGRHGVYENTQTHTVYLRLDR